ncbi:4'-phosphopantetheinyl transferase family protein [Subtercola sp. YIM 133946]|uniref:4'-phosphopantetheinyl transferase family protein n=1 Tax=Subtercola sp. YIM 133946 TaxID=3118909 RepID=UPI002F95D3D4
MAVACEIWMTDLRQHTPAALRQRLAELDATEHCRHASLRLPDDRARFVLGASLVRGAAALRLDTAPSDVVVDRRCPRCGASHGRPTLPGTGLYVSVSHSADLVVVALTAAGPVGIDVERIDSPRLSRHVPTSPAPEAGASPGHTAPDTIGLGNGPSADLSARAASTLPILLGEGETRPTSTAAFYTTWCRKESVVKATGDGMRVALTDVLVTPSAEPPRLLAYPCGVRDALMTDLELADGYAGALTLLTRQAAPLEFTVRTAP